MRYTNETLTSPRNSMGKPVTPERGIIIASFADEGEGGIMQVKMT
jgi:hypothetical protein